MKIKSEMKHPVPPWGRHILFKFMHAYKNREMRRKREVCLMQAEIHMVENKEESLARARERGVLLELENVWFYQANMDYYQVTSVIRKGPATGSRYPYSLRKAGVYMITE